MRQDALSRSSHRSRLRYRNQRRLFGATYLFHQRRVVSNDFPRASGAWYLAGFERRSRWRGISIRGKRGRKAESLSHRRVCRELKYRGGAISNARIAYRMFPRAFFSMGQSQPAAIFYRPILVPIQGKLILLLCHALPGWHIAAAAASKPGAGGLARPLENSRTQAIYSTYNNL